MQKEKLSLAELRGSDDIVLWDRNLEEASLLEVTKEKGIGGFYDAVIDFVGMDATVNRTFNCLNGVRSHFNG